MKQQSVDDSYGAVHCVIEAIAGDRAESPYPLFCPFHGSKREVFVICAVANDSHVKCLLKPLGSLLWLGCSIVRKHWKLSMFAGIGTDLSRHSTCFTFCI